MHILYNEITAHERNTRPLPARKQVRVCVHVCVCVGFPRGLLTKINICPR